MSSKDLVVIDEEKNNVVKDQLLMKKSNYEEKFRGVLKELWTMFNDEYKEVDVLSDEDLDKFLTIDESDIHQNKEKVIEIVNRIIEVQTGICKIEYYESRNRIDDYTKTLDLSLSVSELKDVKSAAIDILFKKYKLDKLLQSTEAFSSVFKSFTEKNVDFKLRYEINKNIMCNLHGYTPESVDVYFEALKEYNTKKLFEVGSNVEGKLAHIHSDAVNKEYSHLLVKVPDWDGKTVVYDSEFLKQYKAKVDDIEQNRPKDTEGALMYKSMVQYMNDLRDKFNGKANNTAIAIASKSSSEEVKKNTLSLREQRLLRKQQSKKEEVKEEIPEATPTPVVKKEVEYDYVSLTENKPKIPPRKKREPQASVTNLVHVGPPGKAEPIPNAIAGDVVKVLLSEKEESVLNGENAIKIIEEATVVEETNSVIEEVTYEETEVIIEPDTPAPLPEPKVEVKPVVDTKEIDNIFKLVSTPPDTSILRSNNPFKLRLFNESSKYGRLLYLPYSNYEILVKRINDKAQLSYVLDLMNKKQIINDGVVEYEIMRIVYKNIEFPFDDVPNEVDFFKNLSIRDVPIIINMLAMISQKEIDNRVDVEIDKVTCLDENHNYKIVLKQPIKIDLKSKFAEIYPIELYYENYTKYQESKFTNIYAAYATSLDGRLVSFNHVDGHLNYTVIYGRTNYFLASEEMKKKKNEAIYKIFIDDLKESDDKYRGKYGDDIDLEKYIEGKTLIQHQIRFDQLLSLHEDIDEESTIVDDTRSDEEKDIIQEYKTLKGLFMEMDLISNNISNVLNVASCVRVLKVSTLEPEEVVIESSTIDVYELFQNIIALPTDLYREILNKYQEYLKEVYEYDYKKSFIKVTSDDIRGLVDIDKHLKHEDDFSKEIDEKYKDNPVAREHWFRTYKASKDNLMHGVCTCGCKEFYINHYNLLFFSITHQVGVKVEARS